MSSLVRNCSLQVADLRAQLVDFGRCRLAALRFDARALLGEFGDGRTALADSRRDRAECLPLQSASARCNSLTCCLWNKALAEQRGLGGHFLAQHFKLALLGRLLDLQALDFLLRRIACAGRWRQVPHWWRCCRLANSAFCWSRSSSAPAASAAAASPAAARARRAVALGPGACHLRLGGNQRHGNTVAVGSKAQRIDRQQNLSGLHRLRLPKHRSTRRCRPPGARRPGCVRSPRTTPVATTAPSIGAIAAQTPKHCHEHGCDEAAIKRRPADAGRYLVLPAFRFAVRPAIGQRDG